MRNQISKSILNPGLLVILMMLTALFTGNCTIDGLQFFYTPYGVTERFHESTDPAAGIIQHSSTSIADENNFSFIHITDIHVTGGGNPYLSALVGQLIPTDKFIIASGDLTDYGKSSDFVAFRDTMNSTQIPWYPVIGNHDLWFEGWQEYKQILGPSVYSVRAGNIRIIVLDSANDTLGSEQLDWLKQQLDSKTEPLCVISMHYNYFSAMMMETSQSTDMEEVYNLMRLFEKHRVNYVLLGHSHIYDHREINGVNYLVGGALKVYSKDTKEQKKYNRLTVSNGTITHLMNEFSY